MTRKAGKPITDLSVRMRNWFWYWSLRYRLGDVSDSDMDLRFIVKLRPSHAEPPRYFERMRRGGWGPDEVPSAWRGSKLLEIVDSCADCSGLKADFESPIWRMIGDRSLPATWYTELIEELLLARGESREPGAYSWFYGTEFDPERTFDSGEPLDEAYLAMLERLKLEASFQSLSLLCALFREAWHALHLHQLIPLANAVLRTTVAVCESRNIPSVCRMLMHRLVLDRVLGNVWLEQSDWADHVGYTPRLGRAFAQRARELEEFVLWYVFRPSQLTGSGYGALPIR